MKDTRSVQDRKYERFEQKNWACRPLIRRNNGRGWLYSLWKQGATKPNIISLSGFHWSTFLPYYDINLLLAVKNKNIDSSGTWLRSNFNEPYRISAQNMTYWQLRYKNTDISISLETLEIHITGQKLILKTTEKMSSGGWSCVCVLARRSSVLEERKKSISWLFGSTKLLIHYIVRNIQLAPAWIASPDSWQCCYRGIVNSAVNSAAMSALRVSINVESPRCDHEKTCMIL